MVPNSLCHLYLTTDFQLWYVGLLPKLWCLWWQNWLTFSLHVERCRTKRGEGKKVNVPTQNDEMGQLQTLCNYLYNEISFSDVKYWYIDTVAGFIYLSVYRFIIRSFLEWEMSMQILSLGKSSNLLAMCQLTTWQSSKMQRKETKYICVTTYFRQKKVAFKFLLVVSVVLQCYRQLISEKRKKTAEETHEVRTEELIHTRQTNWNMLWLL